MLFFVEESSKELITLPLLIILLNILPPPEQRSTRVENSVNSPMKETRSTRSNFSNKTFSPQLCDRTRLKNDF